MCIRDSAAPDRYPGELPDRADVLVIGGGITGVSLGFTESGLPLIGPVDGMPNVYLCAGYNGHGMGFAFMSAKQLVNSL